MGTLTRQTTSPSLLNCPVPEACRTTTRHDDEDEDEDDENGAYLRFRHALQLSWSFSLPIASRLS